MSDNIDKLQKTFPHKPAEGIEQEHFRTLMRRIGKHQAGTGPRPTGRLYRAWFAAMATKALLSHFGARPAHRFTAPAARPGIVAVAYLIDPEGKPVAWGTIFAGVSIAAALSLLFSKSSR